MGWCDQAREMKKIGGKNLQLTITFRWDSR